MAGRVTRALGSRWAVVVVLVGVMAVASSSIAIGFLTDDHAFRAVLRSTNARAPAAYDLFRFVPGGIEDNQLRIRYGVQPWWSAPDLKIHFWRPLTSLAFAADDRMFGAAPLGYHLVSLGWYLAMLVLAAAVFRRLLSPVAATVAVAVFGLSAAHVDGYAWISARHVVIAGALSAATLLARWSRWRWLAPVVFVGALASSEAALAVAPLWIALELAAERPWRSRLRACVPVVALSVAYVVVYAALGGGTRGSGGYHDPMADPLGFVALAAIRVPLLLGDAALGIPAELAHVVAEWKLCLCGIAAVGVVGLAWWSSVTGAEARAGVGDAADRGVSASGEARRIGWLAIGGVAATVLGAAGFPSGRVLTIPDLAFAAVLGLVVERGMAARWGGRALAVVLVVVHVVVAPVAVLRAVARHEGRARATEAIAARVVELAPPLGRVMIVAASDPMVFLYPRGVLADVAPGTVRCWSVWSAARAGHRVTRSGPQTLVIEPIGRTMLEGSFDELYRSADRPFAVGDSVEQCGATIRVLAVRDGRPARWEVTLRRSFEHGEVLLLVWRAGRLVPFVPPAVGDTVEVAWSAGPSGVL